MNEENNEKKEREEERTREQTETLKTENKNKLIYDMNSKNEENKSQS